jgi:hypothetical protein
VHHVPNHQRNTFSSLNTVCSVDYRVITRKLWDSVPIQNTGLYFLYFHQSTNWTVKYSMAMLSQELSIPQLRTQKRIYSVHFTNNSLPKCYTRIDYAITSTLLLIPGSAHIYLLRAQIRATYSCSPSQK